jgi:hypothetical protein
MRAAETSAGSIVRFAAESPELTIRFHARPAAGALLIIAGDDSRSSAQIVSGAHGEAFLLLPNELRIRNTTRSIADYRIVLASTVRRLRLRIGDTAGSETVAMDVTPELRRTIELAARGGAK